MATDNKRDLSNVNFQDVPSTIELPVLLGTAKDVYISIRTDGEAGSGTQLDPLDGSTAAKLDAIFLSYAAITYVHFHLGPGTFQTNVITRTWRIKVGWVISGEGMYVTTLQAIGSQAAFFQTQVLGDDQSADGSDYATVSDLTLDCNASVVGASVTVVSGQKDYKISPARIIGTQITLLRVRGINQYGSLVNGRESWGITIAAATSTLSLNNVIKDCVVEQPTGYGTPYGLFGYDDTYFCSGVVDNCLAIGINDGLGYASVPTTKFLSGGLNVAAVKNVVLQNSTFIDCESIIHHDTLGALDVTAINNTLVRGFYGVSSNNATRWRVLHNKIELQIRNGADACYGVSFHTAGTDLELKDNTVTVVSGGSGSGTVIPIYVSPLTNPKITNNTIPNYACTTSGNTNPTILRNTTPAGAAVSGIADTAGTTGDVSSNTSTSVDGEMPLFSGTGGKTLKRSTLTGGLLKSTSGVPAIAVSGTDYVSPTGSGALLTNLNAAALASNLVPTARLGSGTANSTTFLRGDQTWVGVSGATIATTTQVLIGDGAGNATTTTETGTGNTVRATSPSLTTPNINVATATSVNKWIFTAPANSITLSGTDNSSYAFPEITSNVGFREIPQNLKSANYTLVLTDNGKEIHHPASDNNARVFTIPANSSVSFPIGTVVVFTNLAAASCTVPITSDVMTLLGTGTTGTRTIAQYGQLIARKVATTAWVCSGLGVS